MTSVKRSVRCSNCSTDASLSLNSDLDLKELTFAGKCQRCGATLQINFNIVHVNSGGNSTSSSSSSDTSSSSTSSSSPMSMFDTNSSTEAADQTPLDLDSLSQDSGSSDNSQSPENVSDALKDLMEA